MNGVLNSETKSSQHENESKVEGSAERNRITQLPPHNQEHVAAATKIFMCDVCSKVFNGKDNLKRHCKLVHNTEYVGKDDLEKAVASIPTAWQHFITKLRWSNISKKNI